MKTKCMFISCILALIISAAVWAEEAPTVPVEVNSPQSDATATLNGSEADQFMNVTEWGNVSFNKVFAYIGYTAGKQILDIGAAFKAGPVYIGSFYRGNFGRFTGIRNNTVTTQPTLGTGSSTGTFSNVQRNSKTGLNNTYINSKWHTAAVLIGYGNMGFQLGYMTSGTNKSGRYYAGNHMENDVTRNTRTGSIKDTVYDPKGYVNNMEHIPFVAFGMNIPFGAMTISPTASLKIAVNQNGDKYGVKTVMEKISDTRYSTVKDANNSAANTYVGITGKVGAGVALGDALNSAVKVDYEFTVNAYGKTYTDLSGAKHKINGVYTITKDEYKDEYKGNEGKRVITKNFEAKREEKTFFSNTLTPSYSLQKDLNDRLSLFAGVECPIKVELNNSVEFDEEKEVTETKMLNPSASHLNTVVTKELVTTPKKTTKETIVDVTPTAMAAISYAAIPNRLSFNLGTRIEFLHGTNTYKQISKNGVMKNSRTTTVYPNQGNFETYTDNPQKEDATESVTNTGDLKPIDAKVKLGLAWNITENVMLDFVYAHLLNDAGWWGKSEGLKLACTVKF